MGGGCQGCSASSVTLKQGVESYIVAKVDEVNEIVDITNHSEGVNPYYTEPLPQQSTGGSCGSGCGCSSGSSSSSHDHGNGCGCN
jgi:hypothetical protein